MFWLKPGDAVTANCKIYWAKAHETRCAGYPRAEAGAIE